MKGLISCFKLLVEAPFFFPIGPIFGATRKSNPIDPIAVSTPAIDCSFMYA